MLWACLLLPRLALDAIQRRSPHEKPFALITGPAQRRVLLDANAAARAAGLYPGLPLQLAGVPAGRRCDPAGGRAQPRVVRALAEARAHAARRPARIGP